MATALRCSTDMYIALVSRQCVLDRNSWCRCVYLRMLPCMLQSMPLKLGNSTLEVRLGHELSA